MALLLDAYLRRQTGGGISVGGVGSSVRGVAVSWRRVVEVERPWSGGILAAVRGVAVS